MMRRVAWCLPAMITFVLAAGLPGCGPDNQSQSKIVPVPAKDNRSVEQRRGAGGPAPSGSEAGPPPSGSRPTSYPAGKR